MTPFEIIEMAADDSKSKTVGKTITPGGALVRMQSMAADNDEHILEIHSLAKEEGGGHTVVSERQEDGVIVARSSVFVADK